MQRGFDQLQNERGLNIVMTALTVTFVLVLVGSIAFKMLMDKDKRRRAETQQNREQGE